jgi:hypothetical protein
MACSKYTLTNTGSTSINFNYQRCDDFLWQYQINLDRNETKNIWLVDGTYSIAQLFQPSVVLVNNGLFPLTPTNTPSNTPTPTNTQTNTETPTPTPTNTETPTNTPTNTPTETPTNTPTPTNTETPTNTPTPTNTETPTNTPTETPTNTPTPTETLAFYRYSLGVGATPQNACNNFIVSPQILYAELSSGPGPNIFEFLYQDDSFINPAIDGYYSDGIGWFLISGGLGEITSADPNGCTGLITLTPTTTPTETPTPTPTPTPTANRFTFIVYPGAISDDACGQYNTPITIYGEKSNFDSNTIFYDTIVGPSSGNLTGFYNYSQIVVELTNGVETGGFTACQTLTPTPTQTSTQTPTPTETLTPTQTPTNTETPTPTNTETPTQTPTPTANRFAFIVYPGVTYNESCGQYNSSITIYGEKSNFDDNTIFYDTIVGPSSGNLTGFYNYSQIIVELNNGSVNSVFTLCQTLTPTPTQTSTQTPTPTQTPTNTETPTQTPTETPTQTPTETPTQTPTETIGFYSYMLGYDVLSSVTACSNFSITPQQLYGQPSGGPGPNVGESLFADSLFTTPAADGFYSNGTNYYEITGGLGEITTSGTC